MAPSHRNSVHELRQKILPLEQDLGSKHVGFTLKQVGDFGFDGLFRIRA